MSDMDIVNEGVGVESVQQADREAILRVDGLVAVPHTFRPKELASMEHVSCVEDFHCDHRGTAAGRVWRGVRLKEIIELAQPSTEAKYVRVHAPNYSVPLLLPEIEEALLVDSIDGQPVSAEGGTPWRLYVPGAQCHVSVKWVNRIELSATRAAAPDERVARARQRGRIAQGAE
jgi:DMSO/TMAO reductase YedYZ molybdopterin-dependent catalytic subunit